MLKLGSHAELLRAAGERLKIPCATSQMRIVSSVGDEYDEGTLRDEDVVYLDCRGSA